MSHRMDDNSSTINFLMEGFLIREENKNIDPMEIELFIALPFFQLWFWYPQL